MAFYAGQKVVCVDDSPCRASRFYGQPFPKKKGQVCVVTAVWTIDDDWKGDIKVDGGLFWMSHERFRSLTEQSTDTGFAILEDIRQGVRDPLHEKV